MKTGVLIITGIWISLNILSYLLLGGGGVILSTYICMSIVWFGRKKLIKLLNI
jgi:hypothetical protein